MIVRQGEKYVVKSESGKNLSKPLSKAAAKKRLAEVEMFKHMTKSGRVIRDAGR
jgi:hypothetical protein